MPSLLKCYRTDKFQSFVDKKVYKINHRFTWRNKCLTSLLSCKVCNMQHNSQTNYKFRYRWNNYKENNRKSLRGEKPMQADFFAQKLVRLVLLMTWKQGFLDRCFWKSLSTSLSSIDHNISRCMSLMFLQAHIFFEGTDSSHAIFIIPDLFISGIMKSSSEDFLQCFLFLSLVYFFLSFLLMSNDYVDQFSFSIQYSSQQFLQAFLLSLFGGKNTISDWVSKLNLPSFSFQ